MASWILYLIGAVGLTIVLTLSHLTRPVRYYGCKAFRLLPSRLPCPLYCSMCSGVWVGGVVGAAACLLERLGPARAVLGTISMAFATSVVAFLVSTWLRAHGESTDPKHDEDDFHADCK